MQTDFRYFTDFKTILILLIFMTMFFELASSSKRNPFCFSDTKIKVPFNYTAVAKVHNCSKSFAILSCTESFQSNQNVIAKQGDKILGYKVVDIFDDVLTVQDDKNNEMVLHLN